MEPMSRSATVDGVNTSSVTVVAPKGSVHDKNNQRKCSAGRFYGEYHGHRVEDLEALLPAIRPRDVIWLLGDSSLDNKYWLQLGSGEAGHTCCNGYEHVVKPPRAVPDVAHWVNESLVRRGEGGRLACVNTAVEESTLADREGRGGGTLLAQDAFARAHITQGDVVVVSVGGNDVALRPSPSTAVNMLLMTRSPVGLIRSGWAPGTAHFRRLFRERTMAFVRKVIALRKPRRVVVCTLYHLDERAGGSWADSVLGLLGYDKDPSKLKACIEAIHAQGHATIADVAGVEVVAVPLFKVMDGTDTADYVQRVEPSAQGGRKLAEAIVDAVLAPRPPEGWPAERMRGAYRGSGGGACAIL